MRMARPKLGVFASGTKDGGGSGFENLVATTKNGVLDADIVTVVSNHEQGGVRERARRLGIHFIYFSGPFSAEHYQKIVADSGAEWIALSGWMKHVAGLDPKKTFNIHPALLSQLDGRFGGKGMYGRRLHEAVKAALDAGGVRESGFTMHFVTDEYDRGLAFAEVRTGNLPPWMTADEIGTRVNALEHEWQPKLTNMVVNDDIGWDGIDSKSLRVPEGYQFLPEA